MKLLVTSLWEQQGWRGSRVRTSEGQLIFDVLEVKSKRSDRDGLDMSGHDRRDREGRRNLWMELDLDLGDLEEDQRLDIWTQTQLDTESE